MTQTKLLLILLISPFFTIGQELEDFIVYDAKSIEKFMKSTTYIVLDQHEESNFSLKLSEIVKNKWEITPYEIIDRGTYREYVKDKSKSFLTREYVAGKEEYISLVLFMGGQKQMERKGELLGVVRLKHYTETDEAFLYKLPNLIENIQWQVQMVKENEFESYAGFERYFKNEGHEILHDSKLLILQNHLTNKVESLERLQKFYKYEVALVEPFVIEDAILTEDSNVVYLSIVAPIKNPGSDPGYFRIYRAHNGESVISYSRVINSTAPLGVTGYDLKQFNK